MVGLCGVLLCQTHLCLERIGGRELLPLHYDGVKIELRATVVLVLDTTQRAVVPCALVLRIEAYCSVIVGYCLSVVLLSDAAQSTQLIHIIYIWVEPYGVRHV